MKSVDDFELSTYIYYQNRNGYLVLGNISFRK